MADVTVTSSVQSAVVENVAVTPLFAAQKAEKGKRDLHGAACDQLRLPMAVELDGAFGRGVQSFLATAGKNDPLGQLFFAIALQPVVGALSEELKNEKV